MSEDEAGLFPSIAEEDKKEEWAGSCDGGEEGSHQQWRIRAPGRLCTCAVCGLAQGGSRPCQSAFPSKSSRPAELRHPIATSNVAISSNETTFKARLVWIHQISSVCSSLESTAWLLAAHFAYFPPFLCVVFFPIFWCAIFPPHIFSLVVEVEV